MNFLDNNITKTGSGRICLYRFLLYFSQVISQLEAVAQHPNWEVIPIMSPNAYSIDTRFGLAKDFRAQIQKICNHEIIHTIFDAEPIGPKNFWMCW